jgi:hypothetical protein
MVPNKNIGMRDVWNFHPISIDEILEAIVHEGKEREG